MQTKNATIAGLVAAAAFALATAPASAGHMHGGSYKQGGYAKHVPHRMSWRGGHLRCHTKPMHRGYAAGHWRHYGPSGKPMYRGHGKPGYQQGYGAGSGYRGEAAYGGSTTPGKSASYGSRQSDGAPALKDVVGTAAAAGDFSTLISAVKAAGLVDTLKGDGPFTVLAPNDAAFSKLPKEKVAALLSDPEALKGVLTYHVIPGKLTAADLLEQGTAKTVNGATVNLAQLDVAKADIETSNGIIHALDTVLVPAE